MTGAPLIENLFDRQGSWTNSNTTQDVPVDGTKATVHTVTAANDISPRPCSPVVNGPVPKSVDRQALTFVRELRGHLLLAVDTDAGLVAGNLDRGRFHGSVLATRNFWCISAIG